MKIKYLALLALLGLSPVWAGDHTVIVYWPSNCTVVSYEQGASHNISSWTILGPNAFKYYPNDSRNSAYHVSVIFHLICTIPNQFSKSYVYQVYAGGNVGQPTATTTPVNIHDVIAGDVAHWNDPSKRTKFDTSQCHQYQMTTKGSGTYCTTTGTAKVP